MFRYNIVGILQFMAALRTFIEKIESHRDENLKHQEVFANTLKQINDEIDSVKPFADSFRKSLEEINKNKLNKAYKTALRNALDLRLV